MALTGTDRGTGTKNSSATTITLSPNANITVGSMCVLVFATDNSHAAGAAFTTFTCTDNVGAGNTWTRQQTPLYDPGAASAGVAGAIFTTLMDAGQILSTTTITVTVDTATVASAWAIIEVAPGTNGKVAYVTGNVNAGAGTASPTVTTGSISNTHMVIGGVFAENTSSSADPWVGDADTSNGSWSTEQHTGVTASTSGTSVGAQYKVVTATATQIYNPTASAGTPDCILAWIELREDLNIPATNASGTGSAFGLSDQESPTAGLASGTGTANTASNQTQPNAGLSSGTGAAADATVITGKAVDAELASGTGAANSVSVKSLASSMVAIGAAPFPNDATTITDDFNRANESPIGTPWDSTTWTSVQGLPAADLVSNRFSTPTGFIGGSYWGTVQSGDFEAVVELASTMGTNGIDFMELGADASDGSVLYAISIAIYRGSSDSGISIFVDGRSYAILQFLAQQSAGDRLGIRRSGQIVEAWYQRVGGSWTLFTSAPTSVSSFHVFADANGSASSTTYTFDDFRIAFYTGALISGFAYNATVFLDPSANAAVGSGLANGSTADLRSSVSLATATGAAFGGVAALGPMVATATGTGTAYDATVDISGGGVSVNAQLASGTGSAYNATAAMVQLAAAITSHGPPLGAAIVTGPRFDRIPGRHQRSKRVLTLDDPEELWLLDLGDIVEGG